MKKLLCYLALSVLIVLGAWGLFHSLIVPLSTFSKAATWESTVAHIDKADLRTVRAGSSPSHYLTIEYSYEWQGVTYKNDRIDIFPNSLGRSLERKKFLFAQYNGSNDSVAFVNPEAPQMSLLQRQLDVKLYLRAVFYQILVLYFYFGLSWVLLALASSGDENNKQVSEPTETFESRAWKFVAYFAGVFSLISVFIISLIIRSTGSGNVFVLIFLMFPLAALLLWWGTWYCWTNRYDQKKMERDPTAKPVS